MADEIIRQYERTRTAECRPKNSAKQLNLSGGMDVYDRDSHIIAITKCESV